jgi:pyruvate,orthophosphate dikinase
VKKWVYFFGAGKAEGDGTWRDLLGGKGAGLAEMTKIGLPVPAGFTISTEACDYFYKNGKKFPPELKKQVALNSAIRKALFSLACVPVRRAPCRG